MKSNSFDGMNVDDVLDGHLREERHVRQPDRLRSGEKRRLRRPVPDQKKMSNAPGSLQQQRCV
jgi:hypothetical protein